LIAAGSLFATAQSIATGGGICALATAIVVGTGTGDDDAAAAATAYADPVAT